MQPDERALCADLKSARFLSGEDRGRWQYHDLNWPYLFVNVRAKDGRNFTLRLDCSGYPGNPPTGTFWDLTTGGRLDFNKWPTGGERIRLALNPSWKEGNALYIPCDRDSIIGHDNWLTQYPQMIWNAIKGVSMYLEIVYDLLQSRDYVCAAAN
jgi:hypothetical protein